MLIIVIKIYLSYHIERLHRYTFDNVYVQNGKPITKKEKIISKLHILSTKIVPKYREVLVINLNKKTYPQYQRYVN